MTVNPCACQLHANVYCPIGKGHGIIYSYGSWPVQHNKKDTLFSP